MDDDIDRVGEGVGLRPRRLRRDLTIVADRRSKHRRSIDEYSAIALEHIAAQLDLGDVRRFPVIWMRSGIVDELRVLDADMTIFCEASSRSKVYAGARPCAMRVDGG